MGGQERRQHATQQLPMDGECNTVARQEIWKFTKQDWNGENKAKTIHNGPQWTEKASRMWESREQQSNRQLHGQDFGERLRVASVELWQQMVAS